MLIAHAADCLTHAQQNSVRVKRTILNQPASHRVDRIMFEDDEMSALFQAAVAIAYRYLPVLRRNVMKDTGSKHQFELAIWAEFFH